MRVLVYLVRTKNVGITYSAHAPNAYELTARADTNWSEWRSTTGFAIMLAGASINPASRRQHCITMSSTEAELVGLADCAIELIHVDGTLHHIGYRRKGPIKVGTDNKGAHDLCHRFTSAQNSRHINRKLFKMRELRGAGVVTVEWIPTELNPAQAAVALFNLPQLVARATLAQQSQSLICHLLCGHLAGRWLHRGRSRLCSGGACIARMRRFCGGCPA
jgi:hypothetical protein